MKLKQNFLRIPRNVLSVTALTFLILQPFSQPIALASELSEKSLTSQSSENSPSANSVNITWDDSNRFDGTGLFDGGDGSYENPYQIANREQLEKIQLDKSGNTHYKLTKDIELNGKNWTPIEEFGGSIDGGGHVVKGMTINSNEKYVGFISMVHSKGQIEIKNIEFVDVNVSGNYTKNDEELNFQYGGVAALIGGSIEDTDQLNKVDIQNVVVSGEISGTDAYVSGLTSITDAQLEMSDVRVVANIDSVEGEAAGFATQNGDQGSFVKMERMSFEGNVTASDYASGGFYGHVDDIYAEEIRIKGKIEGRYTSGFVFHSPNVEMKDVIVEGEVIGTVESSGVLHASYENLNVEDIHMKGLVKSEERAAGVIGSVHGSSEDWINIKNVSMTGDVQGKTEASGLIHAVHNKGIIQDLSFEGNVSSDDVASGLIGQIYNTVNAQNLKVKGNVTSKNNAAGVIYAVHGEGTYQDVAFDGKVEADTRASGLIGSTYDETAELKNIKVKGEIISNDIASGVISHLESVVSDVELDVKVIGTNNASGVSHFIFEGEISNVTGTVHAEGKNAGGVTYQSFAPIRNVNLNATIVGGEYVGGITAENYSKISEISGDYTLKSIGLIGNNKDVRVGGVAGFNTSEIKDVQDFEVSIEANSTEEESTPGSGGIAGWSHGNIENVEVKSNIVAAGSVGGIVGFNTGPIQDLYVLEGSTIKVNGPEGKEAGYSQAGGIAGFTVAPVSYASSFADIEGLDEVGGIVGKSTSTISNVHNYGKVKGESSVGGVVGLLDATLEYSYSAGELISSGKSGGLVGVIGEEGIVKNSLVLLDKVENVEQLFIGKLLDRDGNYSEAIANMENVQTWDQIMPASFTNSETKKLSLETSLTKAPYEAVGFDFDSGLWKIDEGSTLPYLHHKIVRNKEQVPGESCPDVKSIETYLKVAEMLKRDPHITTALVKINELPECKEKEVYLKRMEAIFEWIAERDYKLFLEIVGKNIDWAGSFEREPYLSASSEVEKLREGEQKDELQKELDEIYKNMTEKEIQAAIKNAESQVVNAERYKRDPYFARAQEALEKVPPSDIKTALSMRLELLLNAEQEKIDAGKLKLAVDAVTKAESAGDVGMIAEARVLVKALKDGDAKVALLERLSAIEVSEAMQFAYDLKVEVEAIADIETKAKFQEAIKMIELAKERQTATNLTKASKSIEALSAYAETHGKLIEKLSTFFSNTQEELEIKKQIDAAEKTVQLAEKYQRATYYTKAQVAIDELPDGSAKTNLQARLDAVRN